MPRPALLGPRALRRRRTPLYFQVYRAYTGTPWVEALRAIDPTVRAGETVYLSNEQRELAPWYYEQIIEAMRAALHGPRRFVRKPTPLALP